MNEDRSKTKKSLDKAIFKHTAQKTKAINVRPKVFRGGIRL